LLTKQDKIDIDLVISMIYIFIGIDEEFFVKNIPTVDYIFNSDRE